jgi:hypothetical protein
MLKNKRNLVFFGSGVVAEKSLKSKPDFIVDNNPDLVGGFFHGIEIKSPEVLRNRSDEFEVVICTTSVSEVKAQLEILGYTWGKDARVSDYLEERLEIAELEDECFEFLVSSGLPSTAADDSGGGVYKITEGEFDYPGIEKLYLGNVHGMVRYKDGIAISSQGEGIVLLDADYRVSSIIPLPESSRPHGLRPFKDGWVFISSYNDSIVGVGPSGEILFKYMFSDKKTEYSSAQHHCNDLVIVGSFAYVSMFSVTGNWKRGIYDGGLIEVNLQTGDMKVVVNNLTMPHSVDFIDGSLRILNSFKGEVLTNNFERHFVLPGFVRGYDENDKYCFVGESKNRNFSRLNVGRSPVSVDSKITVINKKKGFCRSIPLPKRLSEIHSIILL